MSGTENESLKRKNESEKKEDKSLKTKDEKELRGEEEEEEVACVAESNKVIYFKIIKNEKEFDDFQNMNTENCFQPTFTYELFPNEIIHGYKGL